MTTKDERRQAVLGLLATHAAVQWSGYGQDVAFADEVLELAARLGRVETVPTLRPVRVASTAAQKAAYREASEAIAAARMNRTSTDEERRQRLTPLDAPQIATNGDESDTQGQVGTRTPPVQPGATEGVM